MGMHEGILAADRPWPGLLAALEKHCGALQDQGDVPSQQWLNLPQGEDAFHVAWGDGRSYLLDPAMVLTANPDLVVTLSRELGCKVASVGAETVSGTFWLVASENGTLLRLHWQVRSSLTQALDLGTALPSENTIPLEDVDGKGLLAALKDLGFDPAVASTPTPGRKYQWLAETLPAAGDLQAQIDSHHETFKRQSGGRRSTSRLCLVPAAASTSSISRRPRRAPY